MPVDAMKGGAIIIGSLLWDNRRERRLWRKNNLCILQKIKVYLPIRYGRVSASRRGTYTMVFSNKCYSRDYGLGHGWVVPIQSETSSFIELKGEIEAMGIAERFNDGFSNDWGSVALITNPNKIINDEITIEWSSFMRSKLSNHPLLDCHLKSENPSISSEGSLTIKWPKEVEPTGKIDDLDYLIATVTKPTIKNSRYPASYEIADAIVKANYYVYFFENKKHGISTFQDDRILKRINTLRAARDV